MKPARRLRPNSLQHVNHGTTGRNGPLTVPEKSAVRHCPDQAALDPQDGWVDRPGMPADIHVFAWQPEAAPELADHRHHDEWLFHVVRSETLPEGQKSIGLNGIEQLAESVNIDDLATLVQSMMNS